MIVNRIPFRMFERDGQTIYSKVRPGTTEDLPLSEADGELVWYAEDKRRWMTTELLNN